MPFMKQEKPNLAKYPIVPGSQISVEKDTDLYVSTGGVSFVEGDLLEITIPHARLYKVGEPVKLTVYSSKGFQTLNSSVIAVDDDVLTLLNPPDHQQLTSRRNYPRIKVDDTGRICSLRKSLDGAELLDEPRSFELLNLSLGGVGFSLNDAGGLLKGRIIDIEMDLINGIVPCTAEIIRMQILEEGRFYIGAQIIGMEREHRNALRGYILRHQLDKRAKERKYENM